MRCKASSIGQLVSNQSTAASVTQPHVCVLAVRDEERTLPKCSGRNICGELRTYTWYYAHGTRSPELALLHCAAVPSTPTRVIHVGSLLLRAPNQDYPANLDP